MESCIYTGQVRHRRFKPVTHEFNYLLFMMCLDLETIDNEWAWPSWQIPLVRFRRDDHFGDPRVPLSSAVRSLVHEQTGQHPAGPIFILTHMRYFGYCFNPISIYYCFNAEGTRADFLVAEVTNTPWGEKHCYVICREREARRSQSLHATLNKAMHVSPFMPMDLVYDFRSSHPKHRLAVHIDVLDARKDKVFDATLTLRRKIISTRTLALAIARFPLITLQVIIAIHWQAVRLWLKGLPVFEHQKKAGKLP